jgi:hypothetical protein
MFPAEETVRLLRYICSLTGFHTDWLLMVPTVIFQLGNGLAAGEICERRLKLAGVRRLRPVTRERNHNDEA